MGKKTVLITGATGMIGNIVLEKCINSSEIGKIVSFVRRATGVSSDKLEEVVVSDFKDYSLYENYFNSVDIAFFCIGVYTGQVSDSKFKEITVEYTAAFVDTLKKGSPKANFCFLSGSGADKTEKSRVSFARYKGMAENYIFNNLENAYTFRPAYIYPVEKRKEPNVTYKITRALYPIIKLFGDKMSIKSTELAGAMFKVGIKGTNQHILENADILKILK